MIFVNFMDMQPGWSNRIKAFFTYYIGELLLVIALVLRFCFPGSWVGGATFIVSVLIGVSVTVVGRFYAGWRFVYQVEMLPDGNCRLYYIDYLLRNRSLLLASQKIASAKAYKTLSSFYRWRDKILLNNTEERQLHLFLAHRSVWTNIQPFIESVKNNLSA